MKSAIGMGNIRRPHRCQPPRLRLKNNGALIAGQYTLNHHPSKAPIMPSALRFSPEADVNFFKGLKKVAAHPDKLLLIRINY